MNVSLSLSIIENVINWFGQFLYGLFSIFFLLIDWLQSLFRALAGLEGVKIQGELVNADDSEAKYDIIFYLIQSDIVIDVFVSLLVFMFVMLVLFTAIALIKNLYQEKSKPPMEIISKAFKALWTVFIIPVTLIIGLMFGNIILQAVDEGTRAGGSSRMSATLFMASAYDANRLRNYESNDEWRNNCYDLITQTNFLEIEGVDSILNASQYLTHDNLSHVAEEDYPKLATMLDNAIANGELIYTKADNNTANDKVIDYEDSMGNGLKYCYKLDKISYLVMAFGGGIILGIFIKICYGMVGRIFKCIFDVVLIPVVCAIMPLDDGKAVGSWKSDIIKNVTMAYSTVGILNIYFSILPVLNDLDFTGIAGSGILNTFTTLMLQIIGIATASSMIGTVNGWLGGLGMGNVLGEGDSTKKALQDGWKTITDKVNAKKRIEGAAKFVGAYKGGASQAKKAGKSAFWGGMASGFASTEKGKKFGEFAQTVPKAVAEGKKAGKASYDARATYDFLDSSSDAAEIRKKRYELALGKSRYDSQFKSLLDERLTATAERQDEIDKIIQKMKAEDAVVEAAIKGGYETTIGSKTKALGDFISEAERTDKDIADDKEIVSALSKFGKTWGSAQKSLVELSNSLGEGLTPSEIHYLKVNLDKYAKGDETAISTIHTMLSGREDADYLRGKLDTLTSARESSLENTYDAMEALLKKDKNAFGGKTLADIRDMSEEGRLRLLQIHGHIDTITRASGIESLSDTIKDITKNVRKMESDNKNLKKEITKARAQVADAIHDGSASDKVIDAVNKGSK